MTSVEDQLRALYRADAEHIQPGDLRPPATFAPPRGRHTGRLPAAAAVIAVAAVTVAALVIPRLLLGPTPAPSGPPATGAVTAEGGKQALTVTFTDRITVVSPPGVSVAVPVAEVHAANPQAAKRVSSVIEDNLASIISAFRNRASEYIALGSGPRHMSERITVADMTTWHHYLSIRFDSFSQAGAQYPFAESTALTFDTRTGARILSTGMFTNVKQATAVVRAALLASRTDGSIDGFDLSALSLQPSEEGSTTPLNCYPAPAGLHCLLDQNSLAPYAAGRIEAIIPWQRLAKLLRPGFVG